MNLHDLMDEAVRDVAVAPAERYLTTARRGATRRRALRAAGAAAAAAAVAAGVVTFTGGHLGGDTVHDWASFDIPAPETGQRLIPATGRSTAAALIAALNDVVPGTSYADVSGADATGGIISLHPRVVDTETFAKLLIGTNSGSESVEVNIQPLAEFGSTKSLAHCDFPTATCVKTSLKGGDFVMTYSPAAGTGEEPAWSAELVSHRRGVRIIIGESGDLLTAAQLDALAEEPWWGSKLPVGLASAGVSLSPYRDTGPVDAGTASANPSNSL